MLGLTAGGVSIEVEIDEGSEDEFSATVTYHGILTRRMKQDGKTSGYRWDSDMSRLQDLATEAGFAWPLGSDANLDE